MFRSYKFRIYPSSEQEIILKKTFGCCRFIYNWALEMKRDAWVNNKESLSYCAIHAKIKWLKKEETTKWLAEVSSVPVQQSLRNLDAAFNNFFKKRADYPRFKTKRSGGSAIYLNTAFRIKNEELFIAKNDTPIKVIWSKSFISEPKSCTISRNSSGEWFASFMCEEEAVKLAPSKNKIGIDVGISNFATLSDGRKFQSPKSIRKLRKKMARLQRLHSRKKSDSKNREKARLKVARLHQRIANVRKDFLHKLSTQLVRENQAIALEDLAVSNMVKNRKLSRVIGEQGWRDFRTMLEYKCEWYGRELLVVDRFFPSSKTCSCCGAKAELTLKDRVWSCACGTTHDRDVNAAKNILAAGQVVSACGVDGRPTKNYVLRGNRLRSRKIKAKVLKCQV